MKYKKVNVFHIYVSSRNLIATFRIKERQDSPKLQESVTGMSQVLRCEKRWGEGRLISQTSPCVRMSMFLKPFDILQDRMLDKHEVELNLPLLICFLRKLKKKKS